MEQGADLGVTPVGLGARDTLRLEKGYLLSGQDFFGPVWVMTIRATSQDTSPGLPSRPTSHSD